VIFIGTADDGAEEEPGVGAGAGAVVPPHAAIEDTTDDAKPITASRVATFTHLIVCPLC
jgi:hypothetical protein